MIIDRLLSDGCEAGMHLPTEISLVLRICSVAFLSISKKWYHLKALIGQIPHQSHYLGHLGKLSIFEILHQPLQTLIFVPNPERDCTRLLRLGCNYIPQQSCAQTPFERNESKHETSKEVLNTMHIQQSISLTVSQNCVYLHVSIFCRSLGSFSADHGLKRRTQQEGQFLFSKQVDTLLNSLWHCVWVLLSTCLRQ